jgi:hypothetical protein
LTLTKTHPRLVIGTVSAAEFLVAIAASLGFINAFVNNPETAALVDYRVVLGLLLGGAIMAPFAAKLTGRMPHEPFGVIVGGLVLLLNAKTISDAVFGPTIGLPFVALAIVSLTAVLAKKAWNRERGHHVPHTPEDFAGPEAEISEDQVPQ